MPGMSKVTIRVEPLDGSQGYEVEIPRAKRVELDHRYEEKEFFRPSASIVFPPETRLAGVDLEIDMVSDPSTGVSYQVRKIGE